MKLMMLGALAALSLHAVKAETIINVIQNCEEYGDDGNCKTCWNRFVLKDGACVQVSDLCDTWDATSGDCLTCYGGYKLQNGGCILEQETPVSDCPFRTVKIDGQCKAVSDLCNTWDATTGDCLTCYGGYKLDNGACVVDNGGSTSSGDCPFRSVKVDGQCKAVSDLCNTWDATTADCLTCYGGYKLDNGACVVDNGSGTGSGSETCPFRTVKINGECKAVSDLCKTWDETTALCLTCYDGYKLEEGVCKV